MGSKGIKGFGTIQNFALYIIFFRKNGEGCDNSVEHTNFAADVPRQLLQLPIRGSHWWNSKKSSQNLNQNIWIKLIYVKKLIKTGRSYLLSEWIKSALLLNLIFLFNVYLIINSKAMSAQHKVLYN